MVEDTIMHTCQGIGVGHGVEGEGLVSGVVLETFWDMATAEMLSVLRTNCVSVCCPPLNTSPHLPLTFACHANALEYIHKSSVCVHELMASHCFLVLEQP